MVLTLCFKQISEKKQKKEHFQTNQQMSLRIGILSFVHSMNFIQIINEQPQNVNSYDILIKLKMSLFNSVFVLSARVYILQWEL